MGSIGLLDLSTWPFAHRACSSIPVFFFPHKITRIRCRAFSIGLALRAVQSFPLKALDSAQCETLASLYGFQSMAGAELREISKGNPLKLLNIFKKSTTLPKAKVTVMSEQTKKTLPHFSDFTEEEFQHLLFASYFSRVNRYNLEFLCSPRDAAFSYNWLKRQKSIAKQEPNGSLIINQEVRDQIQEFHRQDNPEEAERLNVIATIVDAFIAIFPKSETHWIPIHLQALDSFTRDLCRKLFSEEEASEVFSFIDSHEEQIAFSGKQMSLNPDAKLLTQRFMEVGEDPQGRLRGRGHRTVEIG